MVDPDAIATPLDLASVRVRLITPAERARWDDLMRSHHYLGLTALVGKSLRYVAEAGSQWLALLGWASAALKCAPRDVWIGWSAPVHWQRIGLVANNSRFLLLPGVRVANLASRVLGLNLARLSGDWQQVHGHALLLAETFIDPARYAGTCYRAANWLELGDTRGFAKSNTTYTAHGQSKRIWVYPLRRDARAILASPLPHRALPRTEVKSMELTDTDACDLLARLATVPDPRARRGRRHSHRSVLALAVCAVVSGARGSTAIAEWGQRAGQGILRRLRCRFDSDTARYLPPSEPTVRRVLAALEVAALEPVLSGWLQPRLNACEQHTVALDGKTLRASRRQGQALHLISAFAPQVGIVLGQRAVGDKSNEITAVQPLLDPLALAGQVVTADALHTQTDTARYLVEDKHAHYLFTVKDNQPTLKQDIAGLNLPAFPPSASHRR